ncbi:hypothetical protein JHK85_045177 [Glycine max]|uniref:Uncharacterized protein n=1 Tax=Glycine max TaxID=3847 RepID=K7MFJ6_SOYBN|nr:hypothetical protein JHK86_044571 [Glycine max]KAG4951310.1 hypothetical protein JHK85_045177 [Glycine max]KAH1150263.1 hypothetical protein GYH30_044342 [Glycine max]
MHKDSNLPFTMLLIMGTETSGGSSCWFLQLNNGKKKKINYKGNVTFLAPLKICKS